MFLSPKVSGNELVGVMQSGTKPKLSAPAQSTGALCGDKAVERTRAFEPLVASCHRGKGGRGKRGRRGSERGNSFKRKWIINAKRRARVDLHHFPSIAEIYF